MAIKKHKISLANLRKKIKLFEEQDIVVLYSAIFVTGGKKDKFVDKASVSKLALITKNLKCENPDKIKVELYDSKDLVNTIWFTEFKFNEPEIVSEIPKQSGFQGLGELEIGRIVDERFKERQRLEEYEQLKERVMELAEENEEFQDTIDELQTENERLEKIIESKTQVRYYAGMLGDILESFGIAKSKVKSPLASLMGVTEEEEKEEEIQYTRSKSEPTKETTEQQDEIPTFTFNEDGRNEIITLMSEYLKHVNDQILGEVFSIFSDIEKTPTLAKELIQYLHSK